MWDIVVKKAINIEANINLQSPSGIREIDSRYPKDYKLLVKKDKDNTNQEYQDEAPKDKAKSHNSFSANQPQIQASKKDKYGSCQRGHPATKVNATELIKKDKDKTKNLSYIEYYIYKQKGYYTNKCLRKAKN